MKLNSGSFVDRVDKLLKNRGCKRGELAKYLGLSVQAFTDWKRRGSFPDVPTLFNIGEYFGVSVEYLVLGKEPSSFTKSLSNSERIARRIEALPVVFQNMIENNIESCEKACVKSETDTI